MSKTTIPNNVARILGYAGLLPFLACTVLIVVRDDGSLTRQAIKALIAYAAVILSFMGAVHWGRAMFGAIDAHDGNSRDATYVLSVIPAIVAWFATLIRVEFALVVLILAFATIYFIDRMVYRSISDLTWYVQLRLRLTVIVITCLTVTFLVFL